MRIRRALALIAATLALAAVSPALSHAESGALHMFIKDFEHEITLDGTTPSTASGAGSGTARIYGYVDALLADLALTCFRVDKANNVATIRAVGVAVEPPTISPEQGEYEARIFRIEIRHQIGTLKGSFGFEQIPAASAAGCPGPAVAQRTAIDDVVYRWIGI